MTLMKAKNIIKNKKIILLILIIFINSFFFALLPFTILALIEASLAALKNPLLLRLRTILIFQLELIIIYYCFKFISNIYLPSKKFKISLLLKITKWIAFYCLVIIFALLFMYHEFDRCSYSELKKIDDLIDNKAGHRWNNNILPQYYSYSIFEDKNKIFIHIRSSLFDKIAGTSTCFDNIEVTLDENGKIKEAKVDVF